MKPFSAEDSLCHEFAALALSSMASDYSSKVAIFENDGMDALVRGMNSVDPDVQKNSVEAISLLLQVSITAGLSASSIVKQNYFVIKLLVANSQIMSSTFIFDVMYVRYETKIEVRSQIFTTCLIANIFHT